MKQPRFLPLKLESYADIKDHLALSPFIDMGFCCLYYLGAEYNVHYAKFDSALVLRFTNPRGQQVYTHPLGECDVRAVQRCLGGMFEFIPEDAVHDYDNAAYEDMFSDYCFTR